MHTATHHSPEARQGAAADKFPPLDRVTLTHVPTAQAAYYLNRSPQTLREWAMTGKFIAPLRVNGRLAWPVALIRAALGVA
jgi:hypothetical protein